MKTVYLSALAAAVLTVGAFALARYFWPGTTKEVILFASATVAVVLTAAFVSNYIVLPSVAATTTLALVHAAIVFLVASTFTHTVLPSATFPSAGLSATTILVFAVVAIAAFIAAAIAADREHLRCWKVFPSYMAGGVAIATLIPFIG